MIDERFNAVDAPPQRPILGIGRGRVVALSTAAAAVLPLLVLHRYGDQRVAKAAAAELGASEPAFWRLVSMMSQPLTWFVVAVLGFGAAAAYNWSNTARWMGMLTFAVLWASLANIAVVGHPSGAATPGAVATVLSLWALRWWPAWVGLAILGCAAEAVEGRASGTQVLLGALLGSLGVLLVEYAWHHAVPHALPRRNAPLRS